MLEIIERKIVTNNIYYVKYKCNGVLKYQTSLIYLTESDILFIEKTNKN